jgi:alpha-D-ribose 1-methylphosphonate 5-phosphate C-P lyase
VKPLEFDDVPFRIENQRGWVCHKSGIQNKFMTEIPQEGGTALHEVSDTGYVGKVVDQKLGETYYDDAGAFYHDGYLKS